MEPEQIIRHNYRVPVSESDGISIRINGREYEAVNLSNHGIEIRITSPDLFTVDSLLSGIEIKLGDHRLLFEGKVVHLSKLKDDYRCGIDLVNTDKANEEILFAFVKRIRAGLFKGE